MVHAEAEGRKDTNLQVLTVYGNTKAERTLLILRIIVNAAQVASLANSYGCISMWVDDEGMFHGDLKKHYATLDKVRFMHGKDLIKWFEKKRKKLIKKGE